MKKFKMYVLSVLAIVLGVNFTFTGNAVSAQEGGLLAKVQEEGKLILGTSADFPPFEWHLIEDGEDKIVGFDIDIAQAIADELGVELVVEDMNFDSLVAALKTGKVDIVMAGMNPTPERQEEVDFSEIYYQSGFVALVNKGDEEKYASFEELAEAVIGVQKGSTPESFIAEQLPDATITSMPKNDALVVSLASNRLDVVVIDKVVGEQFVKANPNIAVASVEIPNEEDGMAIAIAKNNEDFVAEIQTILDGLAEAGTIDEIFIKNSDLMSESVE